MLAQARSFDRHKALEAILHIAQEQNAPTRHRISTILYFAAKRHLQCHGRLIYGNRYIAMEYGPVPSTIHDMMKVAR